LTWLNLGALDPEPSAPASSTLDGIGPDG